MEGVGRKLANTSAPLRWCAAIFPNALSPRRCGAHPGQFSEQHSSRRKRPDLALNEFRAAARSAAHVWRMYQAIPHRADWRGECSRGHSHDGVGDLILASRKPRVSSASGRHSREARASRPIQAGCNGFVLPTYNPRWIKRLMRPIRVAPCHTSARHLLRVASATATQSPTACSRPSGRTVQLTSSRFLPSPRIRC
jgi:hypothetical protein